MDINEERELHTTIGKLIGGFNSWKQIDDFFETNADIKPFYKEVQNEYLDCGKATFCICIIQKMLERLDTE